MTLGEKLQLLRKQKGLSQEQLAAQLTVSRQAISKWELDASLPDTENIVQISNLFGVSTDYLLKEDCPQTESLPPPPQKSGEQAGNRRWGAMLMLAGGLGILAFWILSAVYPVVTGYTQASADGTDVKEYVKYGLPAFLEYHNMELLFALCCLTGAVGILVVGYTWFKARRKKP